MVEIKDISTTVTYPTIDAAAYMRASASDTIISDLTKAAFQKAESVIGRSLAVHTFQQEVTEHDGEIDLLYPPINAITSVKYFDGLAWNDLTTNDYTVIGLTDKRIVVSEAYQNIRIEFTTTSFADDIIKKLVKDLIFIWYDNRPDADNLEHNIIKRLAKYKKCLVE